MSSPARSRRVTVSPAPPRRPSAYRESADALFDRLDPAAVEAFAESVAAVLISGARRLGRLAPAGDPNGTTRRVPGPVGDPDTRRRDRRP